MDGITVVLAAVVALAGVIVGAWIQKICKFIIPIDFLTLVMMAAIVVNMMWNFVPIDWTWYLSYVVGYLVGYLVVGRTTYTMIVEMPTPDHIRVYNKVIYEDSGGTYIQEQKNRALAERLIWGNQNEIVSNVPLSDDKIVSYDRPLFPKWEDRAIMAERVYTTVTVKEGWILKHKIYTTNIDVAYGSATSKIQLMYDIGVLKDMQMQIIDLSTEVHRLEGETGPRMLEHAIQLDMAAKRMTPENRALSLARALRERKDNIPNVGEVTADAQ